MCCEAFAKYRFLNRAILYVVVPPTTTYKIVRSHRVRYGFRKWPLFSPMAWTENGDCTKRGDAGAETGLSPLSSETCVPAPARPCWPHGSSRTNRTACRRQTCVPRWLPISSNRSCETPLVFHTGRKPRLARHERTYRKAERLCLPVRREARTRFSSASFHPKMPSCFRIMRCLSLGCGNEYFLIPELTCSTVTENLLTYTLWRG